MGVEDSLEPLKANGREVMIAAATRRRLCSRSVVDEELDARGGVLDVLAGLDDVWESSAARSSRLVSIGLDVGSRGEGNVADAMGSMSRRWGRSCGRWNGSRTSRGSRDVVDTCENVLEVPWLDWIRQEPSHVGVK